MSHQSALIASDIQAYLKSQERKSLLRFITCGSVDDGKSTLIGRLLWDSRLIFDDQLAALKQESKRLGTQGDEVDYALLLDGLQAEREQGITIDVAYRFFSTDRRKFIVADTPGHEQYTRNMVTGASTADVAVILVDARKGILTQTRRHSFLASLVGIRHVVLAVNKMDLVDYQKNHFEKIRKEYELFATGLGFHDITAIPLSALKGDNVLETGFNMPWFAGPTLMAYLEQVKISNGQTTLPFRMRIQWVNRPRHDFRGFCGTIASGSIRPGDQVLVTSSGLSSRVERIVTIEGDLECAIAGQAVTLTLANEIDISRGDLLTSIDARPVQAERFTANLVWLHEEGLQLGRSYLLKAGATTVPACVDSVRYKIDINSLKEEASDTLALNEIGACELVMNRPIAFDSYRECRSTGSFILIDRLTNATIAAGMIEGPSKPSGRCKTETAPGSAALSDRSNGNNPVICFTEESNQDFPSLAEQVKNKMQALGIPVCLLDEEVLRNGLNQDLGKTDKDRKEALRRLNEVAMICVGTGVNVLVQAAPGIGAWPEANKMIRIEPEEILGKHSKDAPFENSEKLAEKLVKTYFYR